MGASAPCCSSKGDPHDAPGSDPIGNLSDEKLALKAQEPITSDEIALVQKTWSRVLELGPEKVGVALFKNIFKLAPEALNLFPFKAEPNVLTFQTPGLKAHAVRVVGVVGLAVTGLRNPKSLKTTLQELGLRHHGYGVKRAHYDVVGKALILLLEAAFREAFTKPVQVAWAKVWTVVSQSMLSGAPDSDDHPAFESSPGKLSEAEVALVKRSWASAMTLGEEAVGVLLFRHIFTLAPQALQLFPFKDEVDLYESARLKSHAKRVIATVDVAINGLQDLDYIRPTLEGLGSRHVGYGVQAAHYNVVGEALLATLREGLGKAFTPELESAWSKVWVTVSTAMRNGSS